LPFWTEPDLRCKFWVSEDQTALSKGLLDEWLTFYQRSGVPWWELMGIDGNRWESMGIDENPRKNAITPLNLATLNPHCAPNHRPCLSTMAYRYREIMYVLHINVFVCQAFQAQGSRTFLTRKSSPFCRGKGVRLYAGTHASYPIPRSLHRDSE
jgi:hypothetical protein